MSTLGRGEGTGVNNNVFERTVKHSVPRLSAAQASWPAVQLDR